MPTMAQLNGLSYERASLFGMPNAGSRYTDGKGHYALDDDARCLLCGRPATNSHHVVHRSTAKVFHLGGHELRSPLCALCGSGTTGCHGLIHSTGRWRIKWVWDDADAEGKWWDGTLLEELEPHDQRLYQYGHYEIYDSMLRSIRFYRGE